MLNRLFKKTKDYYFADWAVDLNGDAACQAFLEIHCISKSQLKNADAYIRLSFKNDVLVGATLYEGGKPDTSSSWFKSMEFDKAIGKLEDAGWVINNVYSITPDKNGLSYLGGKPPLNFKLPEDQSALPFQYLGLLSNKDEAFKWLPFHLNLICPIYLNFDFIYLDYTDPDCPIILNHEEVRNFDYFGDYLKADLYVEFEQVPIKAQKSKNLVGKLGHTGVPHWIQQPKIPQCPVSGRYMKFVCQFNYDLGIEVANANVTFTPEQQHHQETFQTMNFWGDGDLFVFLEPQTKIACYFIQHT